MAAEVPMARAADAGLTCSATFWPMNPNNSTGLRPEGAVMPSALGSWLVRMRVPTPVVNPAMTLTGQSLATTPSLVTPDANWRAPHPRVMTGRASRPWASTAPTTKREMAAAGPVTARVVPPMSPPATPETAAVTRPTSAGTPEARAIASERGTATHPTVSPAEMSVKTVSLLNMCFHSGIMVLIPRMSKPLSEAADLTGDLARVSFSSSSVATLVEADRAMSMGGRAEFLRKLLGVLIEKDRVVVAGRDLPGYPSSRSTEVRWKTIEPEGPDVVEASVRRGWMRPA
mmetsp:Transcript_22966/g.48888  ORF Transcript_22966/g.48888 Transcript_22966/m.48888 type:complete len:287 (-) Transcript_22966:440-1300(-)